MLLEKKTAIVYGGGGHIGAAVARAFAREGAHVHLAGRTEATLRAVADDINATGGPGRASAAVVDALDAGAVDRHTDEVAAAAGGLDISVNVISDADIQGTPLVEMDIEDYLRPVTVALRSKFLTSRAAARHMTGRRSGVILFVGGTFDRSVAGDVYVGGLQPALDAVESLRRQLAAEIGRYGVRVLTLRTSGFPESIPESYDEGRAIRSFLDGRTLTGRAATLAEAGEIAAFVASDRARTLSGTAVNMTVGASLD
ncbi:SDR family oxidoreductase [Streptomyces sp. NBC_01498]|uniref:SDR family NAD(P)-dependent oxidoreductase n=1 Tax=Streptomyces sp. NBC_01498 TaxID=2975870 RepID=UPI002E7C0418|nr:SDR family oxidoreductase [Streptomyces sp. NBC_01498]WTL26656.1 SDR family oxidoreductase [Streptomyces sp. NBC_01498]